jgi:hypothetical protein
VWWNPDHTVYPIDPVPLGNTIRYVGLRILGESGGVRVFVDQAAQDGSSVDPCRVKVRRVPCSMNTKTCIRFSSTISTCRKSTARIPAAWARRTAVRWHPGGGVPDRRRRRTGSPRQWTALRRCRASPARPGSGDAPQRILPRQAQHQPLDTRGGRRTAGPAPPARVVLFRRQPAVPGQQRRGRDGEHLARLS